MKNRGSVAHLGLRLVLNPARRAAAGGARRAGLRLRECEWGRLSKPLTGAEPTHPEGQKITREK